MDRDDPGSLRPLYAVDGEPPIAEAELGHLLGYAASRPVRIGNGAASQLQVDVFGAVVDLVHTHVTFGGAIDDRQWRLVTTLVEAVEARWQEPDSGLWELRHALRQHLHAKVMCWVAVDRALSLADRLGRPAPAHWAALAETIRDEVLARGWSAEAGAFTTAYGSTELDAAALAPILHGLLPADDPRAAATVEAVWSGLRENHTVYRYRFDDGFRGSEGGFHICTAWLIEALWLVGRRDEADAYVARNGLDLPEEPEARRQLPDPACVTDPVLSLDLAAAGVSTVLWATGYALDYGWLKAGSYDARGRPVHQRGVSPEPGLFYVGLPWQSRRGSSFIWGVWHDAKHVADQIETRRKYLAFHRTNAPLRG